MRQTGTNTAVDTALTGRWHLPLPPPLGSLAVQCHAGRVVEAGFDVEAALPADPRSTAGAPPGLSAWLTAWLCDRTVAADAAPWPIDWQGTPFQQEVWQAIRSIPRGTVLTYAALAARVGRPAAVRAVAAACAANRWALLVPCHRVVASHGGLAGFRWGIERKQALLALEGVPLSEDPAGRWRVSRLAPAAGR